MEIRTRYKVKKMPVKDLGLMKAYIIYDNDTIDNRLLVTTTDRKAIVFRKFSNDKALCILYLDQDTEVNVIGEVSDFDIVNVQYNMFFGDN